MSVLSYLAPGWAAKREEARLKLRAYEATRPDKSRMPMRRSYGDGDTSLAPSLLSLREQARHIDENHDIASGALDILVGNVIGTGLRIAPQVKNLRQEPDDRMNDELARLWRDWTRQPDVTGEYGWGAALRLLARSQYRDGEAFCKLVSGAAPGLEHGTKVPFSLELLEADYVPEDYDDDVRGIVQGVEKNAWNRPRGYWLYKKHPGSYRGFFSATTDLVKVDARNMLHLKTVKRIGQTRGVSVFATAVRRLEDIKHYEDSERVAARIAASICAYIKRNEDVSSVAHLKDADSGRRLLKMDPGMVFDNLLPGEEIDMLDPKRPNQNLQAFRDGQLRAAAAGVGVSYSSLSKNYNGTYSAQRQELVEQYKLYEVLREDFINRCVAPIWRRFVDTAWQVLPAAAFGNVDPLSMYDADITGPAKPWIDPKKEMEADILRIRAGIASRRQIISERGGNPEDVRAQITRERAQDAEDGLMFEGIAIPSSEDDEKNEREKEKNEEKTEDDGEATSGEE